MRRDTAPEAGEGPATRENELLVEIATRFYLQGATQVDIATDLGLNPSTISRHLKRARDLGIVRIEIAPPARPDADLGRRLAEAYGLARAVVATVESADPDRFAATAAAFVAGLLRNGTSLGLGWGETLAGVFRFLVPGTVADLRIGQLAGGLRDLAQGTQAHELVGQIAGLYPGSRVVYLHAPAIVDSPIIQVALLHDRSVQAALDMAAGSDIAIVGIGEMAGSATMFRHGHVTAEDRAHLLGNGAVGSMNARFFDPEGRPVDALEGRTVAITWEQLQEIPTVVAIAAGAHKVDAIAGALRTGLVDVLVTDDATALALLAGPVPASPDPILRAEAPGDGAPGHSLPARS
jgi:DNA-binding transcriptional regulator LsrR (DeoR family)